MARGSGARIFASVALAAAVLSLAVAESDAASRRCRQIEAQLANSGGGSGNVAKYEKAAAAQQKQLLKARAQASDAGCGFFGGKERCAPLRATIDRMEKNLASLQKKRGELAAGGQLSRSERSRLRAEFDASNCGEEQAASRAAPVERGDTPIGRSARNSNGGTLFDQLFGGPVRSRSELERETERGLDELDPDRQRVILREGSDETYSGGAYRTLCVRTCDGYYFPMSGASSQFDFPRDQKNCESICPGTDVQLYYHRAASEESEAMISASGNQPYTALSTAYRYRDASYVREPSCGCNPQKNFSIIAGETPPPMSQPVEPVIPQPVARPDPAADPETLANAEGGLTVDTIRKMLKPAPAAKDDTKTASTGPTRIRVVGPEFLPDPAGAIDLRAPGLKKVQ